jgi:signal transduction histidine kinase/ActR/RegA family two-component response regulator
MPWNFRSAPPGAAAPRNSVGAVLGRLNWAWVVLPLGALLSWTAFQFAQQAQAREVRHRFETVAGEVRHRVELELRAYAQVLFGLRALFSAQPGITDEEFEVYVSQLELASRYPAFSSLNFARFVPAAQREAFERSVRESGRLGPELSKAYRIRAPQGQDYHFVIDYVNSGAVPRDNTFGIDIVADPARRPAVVRQVEAGELASSGLPVAQVSRELNSNVVPMRLAAYRHGLPLATAEERWQAVIGTVGAAFRSRVLFDHALGKPPMPMRLRVFDIGEAVDAAPQDDSAQGTLIYDSSVADGYLESRQPLVRDGRFEQRLPVDWATRRWLLQFTGDEAGASLVDGHWPAMVLAGGLTMTLLIFGWLQALVRSREHALAAQRAQGAFLASMSHELRTPLNAVLGYAQLLELAGDLNDRQLNAVRTIRMSGDHLLALIDDILDLARVEAGRLDLYLSDVDLRRFLEEVAGLLRVRAEQKRLAFEFEAADLPESVRMDEKRLRQVLLNLLGNAVKFTDRGRVVLRVRRQASAPAGADEVALLFEVEDTGIGMDGQQLARLFQPFQQVGDVGRRRGGSGLGLVISRQLVRLMGSEIRVDSRAGQGSRFWFELRLPLAAAPTAPVAAARVPKGYAGPRRSALLVDDSAENRAVLGDVLRSLGFEVSHAADGAQGLERAIACPPDLILMDNLMPEMNGLEATRRLRALPAFRDIPIIAISASASREDIQQAMAAGASDFMSKPFQVAVLVSLLEKHLGLEFLYGEART